jgi:hypothetical protein
MKRYTKFNDFTSLNDIISLAEEIKEKYTGELLRNMDKVDIVDHSINSVASAFTQSCELKGKLDIVQRIIDITKFAVSQEFDLTKTISLVKEFLDSTLLRWANDTGSGRTNDAMRSYHDGQIAMIRYFMGHEVSY